MNIIRNFLKSPALIPLVLVTLNCAPAFAQGKPGDCERHLVERRQELQKEITKIVSEIVRNARYAGSVQSAQTPEVAELLVAAEEQLRESCARAHGFPRELNKKGLAAIKSIGIYGSARQLQTLQKLILEVHPKSGRYVYGRRTFGDAMAAIQSILQRLHPSQTGILTAAQLRDLDYWVNEGNARGYLEFPPSANLDTTLAEQIWVRLTHPMARFRLLELFPSVIRRGNPEAEKYVLALAEIKQSIQILKKGTRGYEAEKYYFSDLKALAYIESRAHPKEEEYSTLFRRLTRGMRKPPTPSERAADAIKKLFASKDNPIRSRLYTPPRPIGENDERETVYESSAIFGLDLPPELMSEITAVKYDFGELQLEAEADGGFEAWMTLYSRNPAFADGETFNAELTLRDGRVVRVGARFPTPAAFEPNPELLEYAEVSERHLADLIKKGEFALKARILNYDSDRKLTYLELSLHDLPEETLVGVANVDYRFPYGSTFYTNEEQEFEPEFENSFATEMSVILDPDKVSSNELVIQFTLESGKIISVPARITETYRGERPERPRPKKDVDEDDSDEN